MAIKNNNKPAVENNLELKPGATVKIHEKIKEKSQKKGGQDKERIQIFEGIVLALKHKNEKGATITVRKISNGVAVEKIFPIHSPIIEKIDIIKQVKVRRTKLYYLRDYKKKLKEIKKGIKK